MSPAGRVSCSTMPVASLGPWLVTVTVNVTDSPTAGVERSTAFCTAMSAAAAALIEAAAVSLLVLGSGSLAAVLVAMFEIVPAWVTCAMMVSCAEPPLSRVPTNHCPEDATYEPC